MHIKTFIKGGLYIILAVYTILFLAYSIKTGDWNFFVYIFGLIFMASPFIGMYYVFFPPSP